MVLACVAGAKRGEGEMCKSGEKVPYPLSSNPSLFPTQAIVVPPLLLNESS